MKSILDLLFISLFIGMGFSSSAFPADDYIANPIDWPKNGIIDNCPYTSTFDYRNAYWAAAVSYYSYLNPYLIKKIVDAPLGQKVKVRLQRRDGTFGPESEVYGLGCKGHFDFFTSEPLLPKNSDSPIENIRAMIKAKMPYQVCIKSEKRHCIDGSKSYGSQQEYENECGRNNDKVFLDAKRIENIRRYIKGLALNVNELQLAIADKISIDKELSNRGDTNSSSDRFDYFDPNFETVCRQYKMGDTAPPDTQSIWLDGPRAVTIGFRGTEADNGWDIATDLMLEFQQNKTYLPFWQRNIHKGFFTAYEVLVPWLNNQINAFFKRYPNASEIPVFVTGHSLGGAIATIVTIALMERNDKVPANRRLNIKSLYTFGSPRVGGNDFVEYVKNIQYKQRVGIYRLVNKFDVVTKIPCGSYRHIGTQIQLLANQQGNFPATDVQILANPLSDAFQYCAYDPTRIIDTIDNIKNYASHHSLESYYSVLVRARMELNKTFLRQEQDYGVRYPDTTDLYNPFRYPESCKARRIYRPEAPAYLQFNHKYLPFSFEH